MRSISSLRRPAAFTNRRAVRVPPGVCTSKPPLIRSTPVTGVERRSSHPASTASVAKASGVVNGQTIASSGTSSAATAPGPRCGSRS
jgi:hypothetical protein